MIKPEDEMFKLAILATAAVVVVGGYVIWKQKNKQHKPSQQSVPKKWRRVGEIGNINLFPLKSGKQRVLDSVECTEYGPKEINSPGKHALVDRSFVVFDESTNNRITIRDHGKMSFVEVKAVDEDTVVFSNPGCDNLVVKIPNSKIEKKDSQFVILFQQEKVSTIDCGKEASDWFTKILGAKDNSRYRLGYYERDVLPARSISKTGYEKHAQVYKNMDDDYMGSYSDLASYMILTEPSLDDLNTRLDKPVNQYYFRPNFFIKGSMKPYEEDEWEWLKIGEQVVLRTFKNCTRCLVTIVDPDTGLKRDELEPLKTLRTYRLMTDPAIRKVEGQAPAMGLYLGLHRGGVVNVGDPVYINC